MGMFDSVHTRCPSCSARLEFQSKAGECMCKDFDVDEVPVSIAEDLNGESKLCRCGALVVLRFPKSAPRFVSMKTRISHLESDD